MLVPELDKKLSKSAGKIVDVLAGLAIVVASFETFLRDPLATSISRFQAVYLTDGKYSAMLTIVVLSALYLIPVYALGFAWDYATEQGVFAQDAADTPEAAEPLA